MVTVQVMVVDGAVAMAIVDGAAGVEVGVGPLVADHLVGHAHHRDLEEHPVVNNKEHR